jgi:Zn finger protein HypA/HybF involved in hydrogenase expression
MGKLVQGFLVFVAVSMMFLGMIFIIASGVESTAIGAIMVLVAVGLLVLVYRMTKIEAAKPTVVSQTFNVKMDGSAQFNAKEMKCKSCGAPITDKDLKVIQGGIMATCPYCGAVFAMEEAPKW